VVATDSEQPHGVALHIGAESAGHDRFHSRHRTSVDESLPPTAGLRGLFRIRAASTLRLRTALSRTSISGFESPLRIREGEMTRDELIDAYRGYGAVVLRRCRQILGNDQDSRDVSQEIFERCLRRCDQLRPGPELLAWLYRVSTNACLDRLRSRRNDLQTPLREDDRAWGGSTDHESRMLDRDSLRRLFGAVEKRTREVAVYLYIDGMTQQEVAKVSGITDRSVRNHVARLRDAAVRLGLVGESE
jgi:RNA polymerase sigma-70 factor (ECF subfamily)